MVISSKDNETIKKLKKLKDKKYRDQENCYIIEGIKLIKEAINENAKIKLIIVCDDCKQENNIDEDAKYEIAKYECIYVTEKIFLSLTNVVNQQGILAEIEKEKSNNVINYDEDLFLVLDDIQDPGNMGTILRTADSLNLKQIIVSKGSSDIYNPKVIRSTQGMLFNINIIRKDIKEEITKLKDKNYSIYTTNVSNGIDIKDVEKSNQFVLIVGNEGSGVSKDISKLADYSICINTNKNVESLNVAVATSILLYELR